MTKCTTPTASFPRCKGREITASFDGGETTPDGGALMLRQLDREMGLTRTIARRLDDSRASRRCRHKAETMLRQRVFGLALGYEDLNDHHALRQEIALQTAVDTDGVLASQSTLCRFEHLPSAESPSTGSISCRPSLRRWTRSARESAANKLIPRRCAGQC